MPKKYISCIKKVKAKGGDYNPWAVCRVSTGFKGKDCKIAHEIVENFIGDD